MKELLWKLEFNYVTEVPKHEPLLVVTNSIIKHLLKMSLHGAHFVLVEFCDPGNIHGTV